MIEFEFKLSFPLIDVIPLMFPGQPLPSLGVDGEGIQTIDDWKIEEQIPTEAEFITWYEEHKGEVDQVKLDFAKMDAIRTINLQAEDQRGLHITNLPGKIGEYRQKESEWQQWIAAGSPTEIKPEEYPITAAECVEYKISAVELLKKWGEKVLEAAMATAKIAPVERRALLAVEAAGGIQEIEAALAAVEWEEAQT